MSTLLTRRQVIVICLGFVRPTRHVRLVNKLPIEGWIAQIYVVDERRLELTGIRPAVIRHVWLLPIDGWVARVYCRQSKLGPWS
jgi:hypothetical protein